MLSEVKKGRMERYQYRQGICDGKEKAPWNGDGEVYSVVCAHRASVENREGFGVSARALKLQRNKLGGEEGYTSGLKSSSEPDQSRGDSGPEL